MYTKTQVTLTMRDQQNQQMDCLLAPCGLCIHKSDVINRFKVSHFASGLSVTPGIGFQRQRQAKAFVEQLTELTDWTQPAAEITRKLSKDTTQRIRNIMDHIMSGHE